jgi:ferredoxin
MRVVVETDRCRGAGLCALHAPAVFDQSADDGTVLVLDPEPPEALHDAVRRAEAFCPNAVIRLEGG